MDQLEYFYVDRGPEHIWFYVFYEYRERYFLCVLSYTEYIFKVFDVSAAVAIWLYEVIYHTHNSIAVIHNSYIEPDGSWGMTSSNAGFKARFWIWDPYHT